MMEAFITSGTNFVSESKPSSSSVTDVIQKLVGIGTTDRLTNLRDLDYR
jgi:hypothetical protein